MSNCDILFWALFVEALVLLGAVAFWKVQYERARRALGGQAMSDVSLVVRLRSSWEGGTGHRDMVLEAADRLEALEAALFEIINGNRPDVPAAKRVEAFVECARRALEAKT